MSKRTPKIDLPPADDLFSTQDERNEATRERVLDIPLSEIKDFPNHPFKVEMDDEMKEIVESVKRYGVLVPGLARPKNGNSYEMIAGHRRKMASELAERETMPCIIRDLTDDEATVIMVDSNLQREKIRPSEKAYAYKMKLEAMKRQQGERSDLTSVPVGQKLNGKSSRELLSENSPDSNTQIQRYIRLTELIMPLLEIVDDDNIAIRTGVELSYLPHERQRVLIDAIEREDCYPSYIQAKKMRNFSEEGRLNDDVILSIIQETKPPQVEQFKIPKEKINRFFSAETPTETIEETIIKALELWYKNH